MPELVLPYRRCGKPKADSSMCSSEELPSTVSVVCRIIYAVNSDAQLDTLLFSPVS